MRVRFLYIEGQKKGSRDPESIVVGNEPRLTSGEEVKYELRKAGYENILVYPFDYEEAQEHSVFLNAHRSESLLDTIKHLSYRIPQESEMIRDYFDLVYREGLPEFSIEQEIIDRGAAYGKLSRVKGDVDMNKESFLVVGDIVKFKPTKDLIKVEGISDEMKVYASRVVQVRELFDDYFTIEETNLPYRWPTESVGRILTDETKGETVNE